MERGGFSSVSRPFSFHNVMRSIFVPLKLDAHARGLALETSLDPRIDEVAKKAAYPDEQGEGILQEGDGLMMGDEMRLRQGSRCRVLPFEPWTLTCPFQ
jgi:osomolarity two-component system sensor histidine kinase SLN1